MSACTASVARTKKSPRNRHAGNDVAKLRPAEINIAAMTAGMNSHPNATDRTAYAYAPMAKYPACARVSSPQYPTIRFSDSATIA